MVESEKKKKKYGKYDEWEIKDAARNMMEVEKCKKDTEKMKHVHACLKEMEEDNENAIKSIQDIKDAYKKINDDDKDNY